MTTAADVPTALTLPGAAERVIYTGTYSKPYAPGARVGFGILPEPIFTTVQRIKGNHDFGTANLLQQLLAARAGDRDFTTSTSRRCKKITPARRA